MKAVKPVSIVTVALLALSFTWLAGCGSSAEPEPGVSSDPPTTQMVLTADTGNGSSDAGEVAATVAVTGMRFQPEVVRINVGEAVEWEFNDPGVFHSVTAFDRSFDSGLRTDGAYVVRFDTPGTYCYQCLPHPGRNLCETASVSPAGAILLSGSPVRLGEVVRNLLGGGGHMQGKIIVEQ
jgi:plastocyanin